MNQQKRREETFSLCFFQNEGYVDVESGSSYWNLIENLKLLLIIDLRLPTDYFQLPHFSFSVA